MGVKCAGTKSSEIYRKLVWFTHRRTVGRIQLAQLCSSNFSMSGNCDGGFYRPSIDLRSINGESLIPHPQTRHDLSVYILKVFKLFRYPPLHITPITIFLPISSHLPHILIQELLFHHQIPTLPPLPHTPSSPQIFHLLQSPCQWVL